MNQGEDLDGSIYVIWDEANLPVIQSTVNKVIEALDDVIAVSFDTWILDQEAFFVIELYYEESIHIGWFDT